MPWVATITLDEDKSTAGAEVGTVVGTYTDEDLFVQPFVTSMRAELHVEGFPKIKQEFSKRREVEAKRRTQGLERAAALTAELNT